MGTSREAAAVLYGWAGNRRSDVAPAMVADFMAYLPI